MWRSVRRVLLAGICLLFLALFLLWRIDNPRVESLRMALMDRLLPSFEFTISPVTTLTRIISEYETLDRVYEQNRELRRELQRMKGWREAALQLEEKNARLRALNNVRLSPRIGFITGEVLADSGSPFRQSALLNIGRIDGVADGSAAVDGLGLVGRVSGVGERTARIILLTDINSRVPAVVQPSGQRALITGNNTSAPLLEFVEDVEDVRPGDRIVTSGDGGIFPADLLVGTVALDRAGRLRARLAADYGSLEFIRVLRQTPTEAIPGTGELIGPPAPPGLRPQAGAGRDETAEAAE
ncbi:rod shape-determining protein MreC [Rhodobacteraceae bacterium 2CG4]|uniref:Cell shape-determining protein MreC n=2 Tax=Halovulum marinum TaxID=2662447 RepID=A0A6L5YWR3_9RHOB|nr:rod shape-determining protein MreC [Halovulum marinum]MSU88094.1 rod shape-determining protein MreC [Halovulum marinum]